MCWKGYHRKARSNTPALLNVVTPGFVEPLAPHLQVHDGLLEELLGESCGCPPKARQVLVASLFLVVREAPFLLPHALVDLGPDGKVENIELRAALWNVKALNAALGLGTFGSLCLEARRIIVFKN